MALQSQVTGATEGEHTARVREKHGNGEGTRVYAVVRRALRWGAGHFDAVGQHLPGSCIGSFCPSPGPERREGGTGIQSGRNSESRGRDRAAWGGLPEDGLVGQAGLKMTSQGQRRSDTRLGPGTAGSQGQLAEQTPVLPRVKTEGPGP